MLISATCWLLSMYPLLAGGLVQEGAVPKTQDEVVLKNGDRLTGKVVDANGGVLTFQADQAGTLKLKFADIATLETRGTVKVKLATGEVVEGRLSTAEGKLQITPPAGPAKAVGFGEVSRFNEPAVQWHGGLDFAAKATDGNSSSKSILLAADAVRATETDEIYLKGVFKYSESAGDISERNTYLMGRYRYRFSERMFGYGSLEFLSDTLRDLERREILSVGVGYVVEKSPRLDVAVEAGVAYTDNQFRVGDDDNFIGARINLALRVSLPLGLELTDNLTLYPNFETSSDWTARNELALGTSLGAGWSLKTGILSDYDNDVPDGIEELDNTYFVSLGYRY